MPDLLIEEVKMLPDRYLDRATCAQSTVLQQYEEEVM
jgi:hypothetical protein